MKEKEGTLRKRGQIEKQEKKLKKMSTCSDGGFKLTERRRKRYLAQQL